MTLKFQRLFSGLTALLMPCLPLFPQNPSVVLQVGDPGYVETGTWATSGLKGFDGKTSRCSFAPDASVRFITPSPLKGRYLVSFYKLVNAQFPGDPALGVEILDGDAIKKISIDCASGTSGWVELGTFNLGGGGSTGIRISNFKRGTCLRTSAVRFDLTNGPLTEIAPTGNSRVPEAPADTSVKLWIEAASFAYIGCWFKDSDGGINILKGGSEHVTNEWSNVIPAATLIPVPQSGKYRLWVRCKDYAGNQPGARFFAMSVGGKVAEPRFGTHGQNGYQWQDGGIFQLPEGKVSIAAHDTASFFGRLHKVLLTGDMAFKPVGLGGQENVTHARPLLKELRMPGADNGETFYARVLGAPLPSPAPGAELKNDKFRLTFPQLNMGGKKIFLPTLFPASGGPALADPRAQAFVYLYSPTSNASFKPTSAHHPLFVQAVQIDLGNGIKISAPNSTGDVLRGFPLKEYFYPQEMIAQSADSLTFRSQSTHFIATIRYQFDKGYPHIQVELVPTQPGFATIGAFFGTPVPKADCRFFLLPYYYQARRFPDENVLLPSCFATSPLSLSEISSGGTKQSFAIIGDLRDEEFAWLTLNRSFAGFGIFNEQGLVQPAIYAPVPSTDRAVARPGSPLKLNCYYLATGKNWQASYNEALINVVGLNDYRRNHGVSLNETIHNITALAMDDAKGGWIPRAKGWVQIENKNTVSHSTLMTMLEIYFLTGDERIWTERVVPTLEFFFSRGTPHFPTNPTDFGKTYVSQVALKGPNFLYGTSTFQGLHRMLGGRVPALYFDGLKANGEVKWNNSYNSIPKFSEQLYAWRLTGKREYLEQAMAGCDAYISNNIDRPAENPRDMLSFVRVAVPPYVWALVDMYEETKNPRYLSAACTAADILCSLIYTHPLPAPGATYQVRRQNILDQSQNLSGWYLGERFRQGFKTSGATAYHGGEEGFLKLTPTANFLKDPGRIQDEILPAWVVSPAGFTPEQPVTLALFTELAASNTRAIDGPLQPVRQACESGYLMRLWGYTGDPKYWAFARNGVLGQSANYPGYGALGMSGLERLADYPMAGPDISTIYYHHIPVHLGFQIDFLFASAMARSKGQIDFPSVLQQGYCWFINRMYGHESGQFYGEQNVYPTLADGLVKLDTPAINFVAGVNGQTFCLFLMNEEETNVKARVSFDQTRLKLASSSALVDSFSDNQSGGRLPMKGAAIDVTLSPKGVLALKLPATVPGDPRLKIKPNTLPLAPHAAWRTNDDIFGAGIQAMLIAHPLHERGSFFICTDLTNGREIKLKFSLDGTTWQTRKVTGFPLEFSEPLASLKTAVLFNLEREVDGEVRRSKNYELSFAP